MHGVRPPLVCALALVVALSAATSASGAPEGGERMPWSVLSRFTGFPERMDTGEQATKALLKPLSTYRVLLQPEPAICKKDIGSDWTVDGAAVNHRVLPTPLCRVVVGVRQEGPHRIVVTAPGVKQVAEVEIDDRLVVALGDSVASGEGNPQPGRKWLDAACHRSPIAGFEQAARLLAESLRHTSITFVSLACSGAEIRTGLIGDYAGVDPEQGKAPYAPQVRRLRRIAAARAAAGGGSVDAVLLSVGANDIGFSSIVKTCALPINCRKARRRGSSKTSAG